MDEISKFQVWQDETAPLSEKEISFKDSLENLGFKIKIDRPFINRSDNPKYHITISSDTLLVNEDNYESLNLLRDHIIKRLYTEIIADSVLYEIKEISYTINTKDNIEGRIYNNGLTNFQFFPIYGIKIDSLKLLFELKVIKKETIIFKK